MLPSDWCGDPTTAVISWTLVFFSIPWRFSYLVTTTFTFESPPQTNQYVIIATKRESIYRHRAVFNCVSKLILHRAVSNCVFKRTQDLKHLNLL